MKNIVIITLLAFLAVASLYAAKPSEYVNPFIGTGGHGHTYPGATASFGMIQLSPDTRLDGWDGCSAYHFSDTLIYGFSHTHLNGTGCSDYGDILFMPVKSGVAVDTGNHKNPSVFNHKDETASPGYYSVLLKNNNIKVELTALPRSAMHHYTFPTGFDAAEVFIDLKHRDEVIESKFEIISETEIAGYRRSKAWAQDQRVWFYAVFSKPIINSRVFSSNILAEGKQFSGKDLKAYLQFDTKSDKDLYMKIALSSVDIDGAKKNLAKEITGFDFKKTRSESEQLWNEFLGKIDVETSDTTGRKIFYTALYHTGIQPNIYSDVDGRYLGRDMKIHETKGYDYYTVFSLWDTYRAFHPLMTIIDQKRTADYVNTFISQYKQVGLLPVWELSSNETNCMIGYHAVPVIADAIAKGITGFDREKALEAMVTVATNEKYGGLKHYISDGFLSSEKENESVSKTLEYAYDDWCIAQTAKILGNESIYKKFIVRAQSYKNIYDPQTAFMRAKVNGSWYKPFDPFEVNNNYTEANAWQYSFYVPQDLDGLMALHGGKDKFAKKLDDLFSAKGNTTGREQADISGLIGQYAHGNEPSHHIAYLYSFAGLPYKTQERVSDIMGAFYHNETDGLCGNEDCGQMSAWYVISAMGFYSVTPGSKDYVLGIPHFEKMTVNLENGKKFEIIAKNHGNMNYYVKSITLNGKLYSKFYITQDDIMKGGKLEFELSRKPIESPVADENLPKTTIKDEVITPVPYFVDAPRSFKESLMINIKSIIPGAKIYYTLDGSTPTKSSALFSQPFEIKEKALIKAISIANGLTPSFVVESGFTKRSTNMTIEITPKPNSQYTAGGDDALIDGIRGTENWRTGGWQGYLGEDLTAIVDLGSVKELNMISAGFLQDIGAWIWFPPYMEIMLSDDGKTFKSIGWVDSPIDSKEAKVTIKDFMFDPKGKKGRYVKLYVKNFGKCPAWHPGAGEKAYMFIDEIIIDAK